MRLNSRFLQEAVAVEASLLDARGDLPKAPDTLGGKSISDLLKEGAVTINVDEKFPQALGIVNVLHVSSHFGNSVWEVLHNDHHDSPFFTSDFPVAIEVIDANLPINRVVPLAPNLAVKIIPDLSLDNKDIDFSFKKLRVKHRKLSKEDVRCVNRLIVQCAEELVFYRDDLHWIEKYVSKYRKYRVEPIAQTIPAGNGGGMILSTYRIRAGGVGLSNFNR